MRQYRKALISLKVLSHQISLNSTGPIPTPTCPLGMRLPCNFVNVYTIVYHVQYTYTCKRAHPKRTSSREKARVRTKVGPTSRRAERAASAAERPAAARAGHADFLATILARKSKKWACCSDNRKCLKPLLASIERGSSTRIRGHSTAPVPREDPREEKLVPWNLNYTTHIRANLMHYDKGARQVPKKRRDSNAVAP